MKLTIEDLRGTWRAQIEHRTEFGGTLEELLARLAPGSPEEYIYHAAELLGGVLGADVVMMPGNQIELNVEDFLAFLEADHEPDPSLVDELLQERKEEAGRENESWQPTEEQQAYFQPDRTEDVQAFNPDEMPRGV